MSEPADWPDPVDILNLSGQANIVLLCEHASNHLPLEYGGLGLSSEQLLRHIAWDIGAAAVTRRLSLLLDAPAFLGTYSRLLIDLNRPLDAHDSIPTISEGIAVPGNMDLDVAEIGRRVEAIFKPFHDLVTVHLDERAAEARPTRLVSIHSFTPVFFGVRRPWHAGVLFDQGAALGANVIAQLRGSNLLIDANVPYKTERLGDYAIPIHGDDRGIPAIMIEIRNELINGSDGAHEWAERLATALSAYGSVSQPAQAC
jgi:predicted N-formylglutamate amidohydrolase